jgi:hypothetical protein
VTDQKVEAIGAIEDWAWGLRRTPPIKTLVSGDGTERVQFVRHVTGAVQFFSQTLTRCETDGQEYFVWRASEPSGLYADFETAYRGAVAIWVWLETSPSGQGYRLWLPLCATGSAELQFRMR